MERHSKAKATPGVQRVPGTPPVALRQRFPRDEARPATMPPRDTGVHAGWWLGTIALGLALWGLIFSVLAAR